jgi:hypothetical protein
MRAFQNKIKNIKFIKNSICLCCGKKLRKAINLPNFPVTEFYVRDTEKINKNYLIDQAYLFCNNCKHLTISKTLDPNFIYSNYTAVSGNSQGAYKCLKNFHSFFKKDKISLFDCNIIDIGGNDSSFLKFFKVKNRVNIDPNARSDEKKIKIYKTFFDKIDFSRFKSKKKNIFFSSHTLEHLEKPQDLIKKISKNMKDKDKLYLQFPSLERLILKQRFDQLCHLHLNFFSINSINKLLNLNHLYINRYEYDDSHFGTLRIMAAKKVRTIKYKENNINLENIKESFFSFRSKCRIFNKKKLKKLIHGQGFGAGILTPVLAYFYSNLKKLKFIYDDDVSKYRTKFITMNPIIADPKNINLNKEIVITSTSTNFAPRAIKKKLLKLGCKKIIIPSNVSK